ncbi:hypothetical protein AAUPMC_10977, partial [Pasteurella multocida subsp. multocida str. Anand1_cattle]
KRLHFIFGIRYQIIKNKLLTRSQNQEIPYDFTLFFVYKVSDLVLKRFQT